jgi:reductive dehalogenase
MNTHLFSGKSRPVHLGLYPSERLKKNLSFAEFSQIPAPAELSFAKLSSPHSLVNAMRDYQAMMDAIRDGLVAKVPSETPTDPKTRADHLKAFGYFSDASLVGSCRMTAELMLPEATRNPDIDRLARDLRERQTQTLAAGIDLIMADLKESMEAPASTIEGHSHAMVFLYEHHRDPAAGEPGTEWVQDAQDHRACLRATETATVIANYLRVLGFNARAHSATTSDVDLNRLAVAAGLVTLEDGVLVAPWIGKRFGVAAVTTDFEIAADLPLAPMAEQSWLKTKGPSWWLGKGSSKSALNQDSYAKRNYVDGAHPFETLKRVERPTTYLDEARIPRLPKRGDMFARIQFGDLGKPLQDAARGGHYVRKAAPSMAQRRALGAFVLLQGGAPDSDAPRPTDAARNAANVKAASYFLGVDAVGISRCPDWAWYSHDATGAAIDPPHDQAISMIIDQGFETTEGSSGDDWIAVAQSMRAYLRFSLLGGVIAAQIRAMGYSAKAHTVMDGDVVQPPLLLLSGLGEVSRIGEVILNPFLGPRLKSGVVTTDMPLAHDRPVDFGLQRFCESCNKCARECPAGAITAGPKKMFNGYEIWKSDSQKCASYRISTAGGAMCGRCMKTCPWNLEGLFSERPFRWAAMNMPSAAPLLAKLDDIAGHGEPNDVKKWWWDIELAEDGAYRPTPNVVNRRPLQKDLVVKPEDQTLAVYPASLAPAPWPYPSPIDREAGIEAWQQMITAEEYRNRLARGDTDGLAHEYHADEDAPVLRVKISKAEALTSGISRYVMEALDGGDLPVWQAGAHLDIVVAPEFLRQYSMCGDPADRSRYEIAVLNEPEGRGGSRLLHRIFSEGRKVFISKPINHFPLEQPAQKSLLMGGGIGVTPMVAFAHELHAQGGEFALHYSVTREEDAGFRDMLLAQPWADKVHIHVSESGSRADLDQLLAGWQPGIHVYTCGPERYMDAVIQAAERQGYPEEARHLEYFSVPEMPEYENHDFTLKLAKSGREILVPAGKSATDMLTEAGVHVDVKCDDGICGVCKCGLISGEVEHRDFVLSNAQRNEAVILCQSRAAAPGGVVVVDL